MNFWYTCKGLKCKFTDEFKPVDIRIQIQLTRIFIKPFGITRSHSELAFALVLKLNKPV